MTPAATTANIDLNRLQTRSLIVGAAASVLCIIGGFFNADQFFRSYLIAYVFWIGVALGGLSLLMLYHMVGGNWGFISRRLFEAAARTLPFMAILIIPIVFGVHNLYPWARPDEVAKDPMLQGKTLYLNLPFFFTR